MTATNRFRILFSVGYIFSNPEISEKMIDPVDIFKSLYELVLHWQFVCCSGG
jgi:hypothetical protein